MDVLSEVLKAVKLDGALFFHGEFAAPWCAREPDAATMAAYLPTQAGHIIIFHLLLEGRGYVRLEQEDRASTSPRSTSSFSAISERTRWLLSRSVYRCHAKVSGSASP